MNPDGRLGNSSAGSSPWASRLRNQNFVATPKFPPPPPVCAHHRSRFESPSSRVATPASPCRSRRLPRFHRVQMIGYTPMQPRQCPETAADDVAAHADTRASTSGKGHSPTHVQRLIQPTERGAGLDREGAPPRVVVHRIHSGEIDHALDRGIVDKPFEQCPPLRTASFFPEETAASTAATTWLVSATIYTLSGVPTNRRFFPAVAGPGTADRRESLPAIDHAFHSPSPEFDRVVSSRTPHTTRPPYRRDGTSLAGSTSIISTLTARSSTQYEAIWTRGQVARHQTRGSSR